MNRLSVWSMLFGLIITSPAEAQSLPRTRIVNTDRGPVQGVIRNGVAEFRGIPFAAASDRSVALG